MIDKDEEIKKLKNKIEQMEMQYVGLETAYYNSPAETENKLLKEKISKAIEVAKTALSAEEIPFYNDPFNEEQLYFATSQLSKTLRILEGSE